MIPYIQHAIYHDIDLVRSAFWCQEQVAWDGGQPSFDKLCSSAFHHPPSPVHSLDKTLNLGGTNSRCPTKAGSITDVSSRLHPSLAQESKKEPKLRSIFSPGNGMHTSKRSIWQVYVRVEVSVHHHPYIVLPCQIQMITSHRHLLASNVLFREH